MDRLVGHVVTIARGAAKPAIGAPAQPAGRGSGALLGKSAMLWHAYTRLPCCDEVAIMPRELSPAEAILEIKGLRRVGYGRFYLTEGRTYEGWSGAGVASRSTASAPRPTPEHRDSLGKVA
jgi:hypothetical protein